MRRFREIAVLLALPSLLLTGAAWAQDAAPAPPPAANPPADFSGQQMVPADPPKPAAPALPASVTWQDTSLGLALTAPAGWKQDTPQEGDAVAFVGPGENGVSPTFALNSRTVSSDEVLSVHIADKITASHREQWPDFAIAAEQRLQNDQMQLERIDSTFHLTDAGKNAMRMRQVFLIRGTRLYTFTLIDAVETFPKNAALFEKSLAALHWLAPLKAPAVPETPLVFDSQGISFVPPADWQPDSAGDMQILTNPIAGFHKAVPNGGKSLIFIDAPVMFMNPPPGIDYVKAFIQGEQRSMSSIRLLSRAHTTIGGTPAETFDAVLTRGDISLTQRAVVVFRNARAYIFVLCAQSSELSLSALAAFDHVVFSARFFPPGTGSAGAH